jgi:cellulose 1,4-beta-cellobiosidase
LSTNSLAHDTTHFNAAYDVWLTAGGSALSATSFNPGAGGAYLMVWLFKPAGRQPRGGVASEPNYPARAVPGVTGSWDVWVDSRTDPPCISYVSTTPLDTLGFDLNQFIQDSVTNGYGITSSMYLSIIFAGFEIWSGGDGLAVNNFCAQVN